MNCRNLGCRALGLMADPSVFMKQMCKRAESIFQQKWVLGTTPLTQKCIVQKTGATSVPIKLKYTLERGVFYF